MAKPTSRALWTAKLSGKPIKGSLPSQTAAKAFGQRKPYHGCILGIDPSLRSTGLALITFTPGQTPKLEFSRTVKLHTTLSLAECLGALFQAVGETLQRVTVREVVLEQTIYVQNRQTAQVLGAARGAAIAAAAVRGLKIAEYPPLRVKQAVVGFGRAGKEQVAGMVCSLLKLQERLPPDESDAAAVALCHAFTFRE